MSVARPHERRLPGLALAACLLAAALLGALARPAPARAESVGERIILRCTHGESLAGFSQRDYQQALEELSGDAEEYSPCGQQIRQAEIAAAAHAGGAAAEAAPVALAAAPAELNSLADAKKKGPGPVVVGGEVIHPGVVHATVGSAFSTLPAPLLAVLALMIAGALVAGALYLRRRVSSRREH
jgi:hypothetical protein